MNIHLDKKIITELVVCTLLGGIIGGVVGSFIGSRGNFSNRARMMDSYGYDNQRGGAYGRGGMMGGQGSYNQNYQQPNNQLQNQAPGSGTTTAN